MLVLDGEPRDEIDAIHAGQIDVGNQHVDGAPVDIGKRALGGAKCAGHFKILLALEGTAKAFEQHMIILDKTDAGGHDTPP